MDALMLVSNIKKSSSDGYWVNWLKNSASETARLAYVASSRPRHLLVWALPNLTSKDKTRLEKLGFTCADLDEILDGTI